MSDNLIQSSFQHYKHNIDKLNIPYGLGKDIVSKDQQVVFLRAGTPVTEKINRKIVELKAENKIDTVDPEDCVDLAEPIKKDELLTSILASVKRNPVLTPLQLDQTLVAISDFVGSEKLPKRLMDHLTVFSKGNEAEFKNTLTNLVFGTHIGKANNYSKQQLNELMNVLFFENIGFARLKMSMKNARMVHPLLSKEIVAFAGIDNQLILESIMQHEEKLDGSGYPFKLTKIHQYAQISQLANQYSLLYQGGETADILLGKLFLMGHSFDFRTSANMHPIFEYSLQKALLIVMQEQLESKQQLHSFAEDLYSDLCALIRWCNSRVTLTEEVLSIQQKINSALWASQDSQVPFKLSQMQLEDEAVCKEFITDSMKFIYQIVESANYLNRVLHKPIEIRGAPISGDTCLRLVNPQIH